MCYTKTVMSRRVTQRELRNESGRIMRALDRGTSFIVTRNGVPVGELVPMRERVFVATEAVLAAFAGAPRVSPRRFRKDMDARDQSGSHAAWLIHVIPGGSSTPPSSSTWSK